MEQTQTEVTRLTADKWEDYKKLRLLSLEESPKAFEGKYENEIKYDNNYWKSLLSGIEKSKEKFFGIYENKMLVSVGCLSLEEDGWPAVDRIYTHPNFRGKGLSKKIIEEIEEEAKNHGIQELFLGVTKENQDIIEIYKKLGYTETGKEFNHVEYDKNSGKCVEMKKEIVGFR